MLNFAVHIYQCAVKILKMGISQNVRVHTIMNPIKGQGIWTIEGCEVQISHETHEIF